MSKENIRLTEKGIVLCEVWKLQTITKLFGIINIFIEIILLILLLSK